MSHEAIPKSVMPQVLWPAIPSANGAMLLAMQFQLQQTQWWPGPRLRAHQFKQVGALVRHAYRHVPFYRRHFDQVGFDPQRDDVAEAWAHLPILNREQVQEAGEALVSASTPAEHGAISKTQTSGSTGRPVTVYRTQLCTFMWMVLPCATTSASTQLGRQTRRHSRQR